MRLTRRLVTLGALAALVAVPASLPALAQTGTASVVSHRQSVLTEVSPSGELGTSRVFTQLVVEGDGSIEVELTDQATEGLRRLTGFGGPQVDGDTVRWTIDATPDGTLERTVADNTAEVPLGIDIAYTLDGDPIEPDDVVGRSGRLEATYTLRNDSARPQDLRYFDGQGRPQVETVDVAVPMVGSLSLELDPRFLDVEAPGAVTVGDGRGNTVVNVSLLLFEPIAANEQVVTWSADVTDAVVPEVAIQVLPVNARSFDTIRTTEATYAELSDGLGELTTGAIIVDSNAKLLANGAAELFDGLQQLAAGAAELNAGLADSAAPGARQIADGAGDAAAGAGELAAGLGAAGDGANQLLDGLFQVQAGAGQLNDGLDALAAGSGELSAGIRDARSGAGELSGGLGELAAGAGQVRAGTQEVAGGLSQAAGEFGQIVGGAAQLAAGAAELRDGVEEFGQETSAGFPAAIEGLPQLAGGAADLRDGVYAGASGCNPLIATDDDPCGLFRTLELLQQVAQASQAACADAGTCPTEVTGNLTLLNLALGAAIAELDDNRDDIDELVGGANLLAGQLVPGLQAILDNILAADGETAGPLLAGARELAQGAEELAAGIQQFEDQAIDPLVAGSSELAAGAGELAVGAGDASAGAAQLAGGLVLLDDGAQELSAGAREAAGGSGALVDGLGQLADGGRQLAAGAGEAGAGANQLAAGLQELAAGTAELADGLEDAAAGSGELAAGAGDAADGGGQIADGTVALSEQGLGQIIGGATEAAAQPSRLYHLLRAADTRGSSPEDALPYGTVAGADASAVFQFEVAGAGTDDGPSVPVAAVIAVLALGLAAALGLGVRRRLA